MLTQLRLPNLDGKTVVLSDPSLLQAMVGIRWDSMACVSMAAAHPSGCDVAFILPKSRDGMLNSLKGIQTASPIPSNSTSSPYGQQWLP